VDSRNFGSYFVIIFNEVFIIVTVIVAEHSDLSLTRVFVFLIKRRYKLQSCRHSTGIRRDLTCGLSLERIACR